MKVFPIKSPLDGEQVVDVSPELGDADVQGWRKRVNNFTGRSLTHTALRTEQAGRSGRIAALGQLLSPGVIDGLVADKSELIVDEGEVQDFLSISSGHGLDASGEIVTINTALQVAIDDIPVYAPVSILEDSDNADGADDVGALLVRKLGPSFKDVVDAELAIPRAGILILQPVQVEINLETENDPCELDPGNYAYENWQLIDGARLVLYTWPEEVITLPGTAASDSWRNQLAYSIFNYEKDLPADELLPWNQLGVAIGLIGFDNEWKAEFVDRNAVVRSGGKRRRSPSVLPDIGNRFLWQSRFEQFNEQLAEYLESIEFDDNTVSNSAKRFRYLPPVGVLPKGFIDLSTNMHSFFPISYQVEAIPIPYEQLDVVVQDSAALAPFDFNRADRIQTLVPVPQAYYDPDLLRKALIDPEFDLTVARFVEERNSWLGRRLEIRRKASVINQSIRGTELLFKAEDPTAIDIAELASPFETTIIDYGDRWNYLKGVREIPPGWKELTFDDSSWASGKSGYGFNSASVETELEDMQDQYVSVFCRKLFTIASVDEMKGYRLEILSNGGFLAYLNGKIISSHNLSGDNFKTSANKDSGAIVTRFDLADLRENLVLGNNVLAIQAHSPDLSGHSFVFMPRLVGKQFANDVEADSYGISVRVDDDKVPQLENGEPVYDITELQKLTAFFNSRTYDLEGTAKRIWSIDDIEKFDDISTTGIQDFIEYLRAKVNDANDKVDYGFIRLQTDIYRVRQFVLGTEEATKLATSPVLAGIAKGETAIATKQEVAKVAALLSQQSKTVAPPPPDGGDDSGDGTGTAVLTPLLSALGSGSGGSNTDTFLSSGFSSGTIEFLADGFTGTSFEGTGVTFGDKGAIAGKVLSSSSADSSGVLFGGNFTGKNEIEEQLSIIGTYPVFRNVTVGERLELPVSQDAVTSGRATKAETIENIISTGLSMDGIKVPGFKDSGRNETSLRFGAITPDVIAKIRLGDHDPVLEDNEASRFNASIRNMENTSSLLRLIEGRIKTYKIMIERCNRSLGLLSTTRRRMDSRLKLIEDELAEARHDVSVSRALRAEEQERIAGINQQRQAVLEEHVPFLMFRRPRLSDMRVGVPVHDLLPDLSDAPLPLCNIDDDGTPEEISAMMDVIREAPLKWFEFSDKIINHINRLPDLRLLIKAAKSRAINKTVSHRLLTLNQTGLSRLALGISQTLHASYSSVKIQRQQTASLELARFNQLGWKESKKRASKVISLADVIDGNHGRMGASKKAAAELEQISRVAVCLYIQFTDVLPSIRLDWAEQLSQYDAPINLRNLFSLPRWKEVGYIERNEMQRLVDWLYGRIEGAYIDASNLMNELIRICILLASHAPVSKIVSGLVPEPTTVRIGSYVNVIADLNRVRIGMNISMVAGSKTVARATVSDIVGGQVQAHIMSTLTPSVALEKNTRVQIGEPRATGGIVYQQSHYLFK